MAKIKGWHKLNKESTPKNAIIYVNDKDPDHWIGYRKVKNGWQISTHTFGYAPYIYKNKKDATDVFYGYMKTHSPSTKKNKCSCGNDNGSDDPDLLCAECREVYGHTFQYEL